MFQFGHQTKGKEVVSRDSKHQRSWNLPCTTDNGHQDKTWASRLAKDHGRSSLGGLTRDDACTGSVASLDGGRLFDRARVASGSRTKHQSQPLPLDPHLN